MLPVLNSQFTPPDYAFADWNLIPEHCRDGLRQYIEHGIEPGGFLKAVLENDLYRAVVCADMVNRRSIPRYIDFLTRHAPEQCWGNATKVANWIKIGGLAKLCWAKEREWQQAALDRIKNQG